MGVEAFEALTAEARRGEARGAARAAWAAAWGVLVESMKRIVGSANTTRMTRQRCP